MSDGPVIDRRRSLRLAAHDYASAGVYFVIICAYRRECWLAEVMDGVSVAATLGSIVHDMWRRLPDHFPRLVLDEFVLMPNHMHGVLVIAEPDTARQAEEAFADPRREMRNRGDRGGEVFAGPGMKAGCQDDAVARWGAASEGQGEAFAGRGHGRGTEGKGEAFAGPAVRNRNIVPANASPLRAAARIGTDSWMGPRGTRPGSLGAIVQSFKSVSARRVNTMRGTPGAPVWQRNYYEHIVRDEHDLTRIREYIRTNPARWADDSLHP